MNLQELFKAFHEKIKVDATELREKRNVLVGKIKASLQRQDHPIPSALNQGSYIYGVGVLPTEDEEYDIDVGLDFPVLANETSAKDLRDRVWQAVKEHTSHVESRGPCIRVHYAAGYHVDLVCYARHTSDKALENYRLAMKDGTWKPTEPKRLKQIIKDAREPFREQGATSSDQLQRVTRYLKRWNDLDIPGDSPDKPFGLATLLLVMTYLPSPVVDLHGDPDDAGALIKIASQIDSLSARIVIHKPTAEFEDVFAKLTDEAMTRLRNRFSSLLEALREAVTSEEESDAAAILRTQFGLDFPESRKKAKAMLGNGQGSIEMRARKMEDCKGQFTNPTKPWGSDE